MIKSLNLIKDPKIRELGGKGYCLAVLINSGFNVPKGFTIVADAFFEYLKQSNLIRKIEHFVSEISESNFREASEEIRNLILSGKVSEELASEIRVNLNGQGVRYVSIRSSAVSEDTLKVSFAGLYDTYLNIKTNLDLVLEYVKKCWSSLFNERALIYRAKKGLPHLEGMAVVIQEMIPAEISGITFTVHPTDKKGLLIEASYGIGDMIVDGKVDPDDYVVDRESLEVVKKKIGEKNKTSTIINEEIEVIGVTKELSKKQVLLDNKIKEIAKTCLKVEKVFNYPQDIEWCISNNNLWLLQSRAITKVIK
jgi:phosphoenolpyruvate synthase/pyruvate phosphate dikinase